MTREVQIVAPIPFRPFPCTKFAAEGAPAAFPARGIARLLMPANLALEEASRVSIASLSLIWIALVGLGDYWTGPDLSMLIFYLIPITLGTWYVGRDFGIFLAVLSITTSSLTDLASGLPEIRYWNEAVGLGSYVLFVSLLSRWHALMKELDERVLVRTAALQEEIVVRTRLQKEMSELTERERRRLGHDLHDNLCQHLTGTALSAQTLSTRLAVNSKPEAEQAKKVVELIEQGIDLTRNLARGLFSPDLDGADLAIALQGLAENTRERFGVECEFHYDSEIGPKLDSAVSTKLYRIAQEAVANAGKHAHASRIIIELDHDRAELALNVFDNGVGFAQDIPTTGLGLCMMRHSADALGAALHVGMNCPSGTMVSCRVHVSSIE